jgi:hypothetical protein
MKIASQALPEFYIPMLAEIRPPSFSVKGWQEGGDVYAKPKLASSPAGSGGVGSF